VSNLIKIIFKRIYIRIKLKFPSILWLALIETKQLILFCSIDVTFTDDKDGSIKTVKMPIGENLLEAAHKNDIDLEGKHSSRTSQ